MRYPSGMRSNLFIALIVFAMIGACGGEKSEPAPKPDKKEVQPAPAKEPAPPPAKEPAADNTDEVPAAPDPTTPKEIELARKAAMMDGRLKDAVKFCQLGGFESNPQEVLACTLAACRTDKSDLARKWAKPLPKALMKQAVKICQASNVFL